MHLTALCLHNFRLYEEARFDFSPGVNAVRGANARGKTSLLEAIYFLMTGRSFRTAQAKDLIRRGASYFFLDALFVKHGIEQRLRVYYSTAERSVTYNSTAYPSLSPLLGMLQGVVIHPDDTVIIKGAPVARRQLLDIQLAQSDPLYMHHLTRYSRAMQQRNHLLRAKSSAAIGSWEYEMANAAAYVVHQRALTTHRLRHEGQLHYQAICGGAETLDLAYKANGAGEHPLGEMAPLREIYYNQYRRHRAREMDLGVTLTGPHKDDVLIFLGNSEAKAFASEGQQRSAVMALRLAEWARLKTISQEMPLMLVDDLGMSLDAKRRQHLLEHLNRFEQVFISTTDESLLVAGEKSIML